jgi:hypothetical protein
LNGTRFCYKNAAVTPAPFQFSSPLTFVSSRLHRGLAVNVWQCTNCNYGFDSHSRSYPVVSYYTLAANNSIPVYVSAIGDSAVFDFVGAEVFALGQVDVSLFAPPVGVSCQ